MPYGTTPDIGMPEDQYGQWWSEVKDADAKRAAWEPWWDANLKAYAPTADMDPKKYGSNVNTNRDFSLVEQKKAQLFFQSPEVTVKPSPLMQGAEDAILIHQHIINEKLGPDGVNAKAMVDRVIFDIECPSGFGITKMGYENVMETVSMDVPVPDPVSGAPAVDPLTGTPITISQDVPVPIWERIFWEHVSPKKILIPSSFNSTDYDKAPWLGVRFRIKLAEAKRLYNIPADYDPKSAGKDSYAFDHNTDSGQGKDDVDGVEIHYKASLYDESVKHPERMRCLVLIEGLDQPVKHVDSPYQKVDPQTGGLMPDSLVGFPVHICTTRVLTDASYLPSDCTVTRPQVNELNKFREQQVKMRDSNVPLRMANSDVVPRESFDSMVQHTDVGDFLFLPGDVFAGENIRELAKATYPRENLAFEEKQDGDIARTHAVDSNQSGVRSDSARTATELQLVQVNANVRLEKERAAVVEWYCKGVTKFSCLVQQFVTVEEAAKIVGPQAAQRWAQVLKAVPAALAFTARPDSAIRTDAAQDRKMALDTYSFLAKDPLVNRGELLMAILRKMDLDPSKVMMKPEQMPKKEPDPPKISITVKGEDFVGPQAPVMVELLRSAGVELSAGALQATGQMAAQMAAMQAQTAMMTQNQTEHGGMAEKAESLTKHPMSDEGGMQGTSEQAPIGPGGQGMR